MIFRCSWDWIRFLFWHFLIVRVILPLPSWNRFREGRGRDGEWPQEKRIPLCAYIYIYKSITRGRGSNTVLPSSSRGWAYIAGYIGYISRSLIFKKNSICLEIEPGSPNRAQTSIVPLPRGVHPATESLAFPRKLFHPVTRVPCPFLLLSSPSPVFPIKFEPSTSPSPPLSLSHSVTHSLFLSPRFLTKLEGNRIRD